MCFDVFQFFDTGLQGFRFLDRIQIIRIMDIGERIQVTGTVAEPAGATAQSAASSNRWRFSGKEEMEQAFTHTTSDVVPPDGRQLILVIR